MNMIYRLRCRRRDNNSGQVSRDVEIVIDVVSRLADAILTTIKSKRLETNSRSDDLQQ